MIIAAIAGALLAAPDDLTIADIAPKDAIFVVGLRSPFGLDDLDDDLPASALFRDRRLVEWFESLQDQQLEGDGLNAIFEDMGLEEDDIVYPTGHLGIAAIMLDDIDQPFDVVFMATFGDEVDDARALFDDVIDHVLDSDDIEIDVDEYGEATIYAITSTVSQAERDEFEAEWGVEMPESGPMHYTFIDNVLMGAVTAERLHDAIDAIEGEGERFSDGDLYAEARNHIADDAAAFAVVDLEPVLDLFAMGMTEGLQFMVEELPDIDAIVDALGLSDARTLVASAEFRQDAIASVEAVLLVEDRRGLFTLLPKQPASFEAPAFVPDDAQAFSTSGTDFAALLPLADEIVDVLPDDMADQFAMQLQTARNMVGPFFESVGPDIVSWTTIDRPLGPASERSGFALRVTDDLIVQNTISLVGNFIGLEPRDFEQGVIYETDIGGPTIGIGEGWLFVGDPRTVEDAMRADGAPRLRDRDEPVRAFHDADAQGISVMDLDAQIEIAYHAIEHEAEYLRTEWEGLGFEDEDIDMFLAEYEETDMSEMPPLESLLEHFSDLSTSMHATDEAIRLRIIVH